MGVLYRGYCYGSGDTVASLVGADGFQGGGSGGPWFVSSAAWTGSGVEAVVYFPGSGGGYSSSTITLTFPGCGTAGPVAGNEQVPLSDVVSVAWMVAAVWFAVWAVKAMRRAV